MNTHVKTYLTLEQRIKLQEKEIKQLNAEIRNLIKRLELTEKAFSEYVMNDVLFCNEVVKSLHNFDKAIVNLGNRVGER